MSHTLHVLPSNLSARGMAPAHLSRSLASDGGAKKCRLSGLLLYPLVQPGTKHVGILAEYQRILHVKPKTRRRMRHFVAESGWPQQSAVKADDFVACSLQRTTCYALSLTEENTDS